MAAAMTDVPAAPPVPLEGDRQETLIALSHPQSPAAEAFRRLRTAIQFDAAHQPMRTIMTTSTGLDEGKSNTAANLAIAMAQAGWKVALVDCDFRQPRLHQLFGLDNSVGLATVLGGGGQALPLCETVLPQLHVLPSGPQPSTPSELLGSPRMAEVIEELRGRADYVLFDAPPIVAVTDAAVLAPRLDGVLLVLRAGRSKREMAQRAKTLLQQVNATLLGVVLTDAQYDPGGHTSYADLRRPGP